MTHKINVERKGEKWEVVDCVNEDGKFWKFYWEVTLAAFTAPIVVNADSSSDALDFAVDHAEKQGWMGHFLDEDTVQEWLDNDDDDDSRILYAGNHGLPLDCYDVHIVRLHATPVTVADDETDEGKEWNTWNVGLWLDNDEGLYNMAIDFIRQRGRVYEDDDGNIPAVDWDTVKDGSYKEFIETYVIEFSKRTGDGVDWLSDRLDYEELDDDMMARVEYKMAEPTKRHELVFDTGGFNPRPRITCTICNKTLVAQPWMNQGKWDELSEKFLAEHSE